MVRRKETLRTTWRHDAGNKSLGHEGVCSPHKWHFDLMLTSWFKSIQERVNATHNMNETSTLALRPAAVVRKLVVYGNLGQNTTIPLCVAALTKPMRNNIAFTSSLMSLVPIKVQTTRRVAIPSAKAVDASSPPPRCCWSRLKPHVNHQLDKEI
jgi:hypothetical protein